jgi:arginyl-tRNA synthetase
VTAGFGKYTVEVPKREGQGDFSTNMAMVLAGLEKRKPRELASVIQKYLSDDTTFIDKVEIAGPGFVNIYVKTQRWHEVMHSVMAHKKEYGRSHIGSGKKVMVEFVSANPTGPLSIGHGRQAILGDSIARLLEITGHSVYREYYYNDAGRQMRVLGESTRARYLEELGLGFNFSRRWLSG